MGNRLEVLSLAVRAAWREHVLTLTSSYNLPRVQHPLRHTPVLLWYFRLCRRR